MKKRRYNKKQLISNNVSSVNNSTQTPVNTLPNSTFWTLSNILLVVFGIILTIIAISLGIYFGINEVGNNNNDNKTRPATFTPTPEVENTCQLPCLNGGFCDNVTHECVCPPKYSGTQCTVVNPGYPQYVIMWNSGFSGDGNLGGYLGATNKCENSIPNVPGTVLINDTIQPFVAGFPKSIVNIMDIIDQEYTDLPVVVGTDINKVVATNWKDFREGFVTNENGTRTQNVNCSPGNICSLFSWQFLFNLPSPTSVDKLGIWTGARGDGTTNSSLQCRGILGGNPFTSADFFTYGALALSPFYAVTSDKTVALTPANCPCPMVNCCLNQNVGYECSFSGNSLLCAAVVEAA